MSITVRVKNNYGVDSVYPVCETATRFAALLGQRTLTRRDLTHIKGLGYEIKIEQTKVEL